MTTPGDRLHFTPENWLGASIADTPPTATLPDPVAPGSSPVDAAVNGYIAAANAGDIPRDEEHQKDHAERAAKYQDALAKFPANEEQSAQQLDGVGAQGQLAQMLPQMASGLAGAVSGAVGGILGPLTQLPQQAAQAGQQAMQAAMSAAQGASGSNEITDQSLLGSDIGSGLSGDDLGAGGGAGEGESGGGSGGGSFGNTAPTAMLGPPPVPSAGTFPAASVPTGPPAATPPATPTTGPASGGMGGMPMVPPGAMHGAGAAGGAEAKPDTKRVAVPAVKNGAPVQGRFTAPPPSPPVTKRVEGKPVATKRIIAPDDVKPDEDASKS
jgi:hypothetical protein